MQLGRIAAPLIPAAQQILLVGDDIFGSSFSVQQARPFGRLLHPQVVIDRSTCYPNLPGNVSDIRLLVVKVVNAMIQFDTLLMELHTLFFLLFTVTVVGGTSSV